MALPENLSVARVTPAKHTTNHVANLSVGMINAATFRTRHRRVSKIITATFVIFGGSIRALIH